MICAKLDGMRFPILKPSPGANLSSLFELVDDTLRAECLHKASEVILPETRDWIARKAVAFGKSDPFLLWDDDNVEDMPDAITRALSWASTQSNAFQAAAAFDRSLASSLTGVAGFGDDEFYETMRDVILPAIRQAALLPETIRSVVTAREATLLASSGMLRHDLAFIRDQATTDERSSPSGP